MISEIKWNLELFDKNLQLQRNSRQFRRVFKESVDGPNDPEGSYKREVIKGAKQLAIVKNGSRVY